MIPLQTLHKDVEEKMKRAVGVVTREFMEIRGGRATPALVEHVTVDYYGAATPLKQLAAITAPEPHLLVIQPWDANAVSDIEKAIQKASIGLTPVVDGKLLRLPIPPLTGERREELTKVVHRMAEEGRVNIRTLRRDANESVKKLKAEKQISEDDAFKAQDHIQKLTDKHIEQITALVKAKEQELQSI
ncbi:MAG: ribosome recycling factor [Candidatus Omnitrophica bacterium]|nr:ribosome recycling factor [Candidatus Omnitrophota bacterium]